MSKEMMIIFVYDMEYCKNEEDDPASAILYFYPGWVSDQQKTNLCGQIMGTTHFLKSVFSCPRILALQSGKFCIKEFGRFILAVGTDRNIDDWVLQHRADTLTSFINFFHLDLNTISQQFQNYVNFSQKLYNIFETYLKILQYSGNIFSNIPILQLPKSANSVFLEAIQILQHCQEMKYVLGGTLLYHNKVLATQLSADLTKRIVMTDPYRIKSPAEVVTTEFSLPLGVQLLQVYVSRKEFKNLVNSSDSLRNVCQYNSGKLQKKMFSMKTSISKEPILSVMKRDQSLIFTTVPEEDVDHTSPSALPPVIPTAKSVDRPKSLNLKSSFCDSKPAKMDKVASTPFTGQTSVCSTPMTDKFLHENPLLICRDQADNYFKENGSNNSSVKTAGSESVNSVLSALNSSNNVDVKCKRDAVLEGKFPVSNILVPVNLSDKKYSASSSQIHSLQTNKVMMRCYGIGLSTLRSVEPDAAAKSFNTITDPTYPVFRSDGLTVSKPLHDTYLAKQCELLCSEYADTLTDKENRRSSLTTTDDWKSLDDFDCDNQHKFPEEAAADSLPSRPAEKDRRSLSLPLKSLNWESEGAAGLGRRSLGGVQLTPLMSKLSLLALEERSSGFCSRDTTPGEFRDAATTPGDRANLFFRRHSGPERQGSDDSRLSDDDDFQKLVLFVCGQQDMVLAMLLEEDSATCQDLIKKIWDICTETLGKLEVQLRHCLDPQPVGSMEQSESYSYLCVDPHWDTVQRGGPWGVTELGALTHLHRDFSQNNNLTEITLRNEDSIIYGYRCGETEIFYQQSAASNAGLPPPTDPMGVVPLKAKRKLERDHAIILL